MILNSNSKILQLNVGNKFENLEIKFYDLRIDFKKFTGRQ